MSSVNIDCVIIDRDRFQNMGIFTVYTLVVASKDIGLVVGIMGAFFSSLLYGLVCYNISCDLFAW